MAVSLLWVLAVGGYTIIEYRSSSDAISGLADWDAAISIAEARYASGETELSDLIAEAKKRRGNLAYTVLSREKKLKTGLYATGIPPLVFGMALVLLFWIINGFRRQT